MTPRAEIAYLKLGASAQDILAVLEAQPHSRYPVVKDTVEEIVGVVSARTLLLDALRGQASNLEAIAEPSITLPAHVSGMALLEQFRSSATSMAFIVDEYGSLLGIVTLHDILEAIAGELAGAPDERMVLRRDDGSWLLDGQVALADLLNPLEIRATDEELDGIETIAGLVMAKFDRVAKTGDAVEWHGWKFEVIDMDGYRIDKVLATPLTQR
jgi:putative hemolysin